MHYIFGIFGPLQRSHVCDNFRPHGATQIATAPAVSRALRAQNPERVSKKSPGAGSKKCPKQSRNSLRSLKIDCFETPETVSDTFEPRGRKAPGDSLETLSGFWARRARETPVRGGRGVATLKGWRGGGIKCGEGTDSPQNTHKHIYIYIYTVQLKTGLIFALFKVKNWSNFVCLFVFLYFENLILPADRRGFLKNKQKKQKKTYTQFLKLKTGPIMLRNILGPVF